MINYFGNLFLKHEKVSESANKLESLKTISYRLSKTFLCFRNRFPKQFYNNSSGFPTWFLGNQDIRKPWKPVINLKNFSEKYDFSEKKTRSGPYLGLGLSINIKKRNKNLAGLSL
jgi:hypothetical protein